MKIDMYPSHLLLRIVTPLAMLLIPVSIQAQDRDRVFPVKGAAVTGKIVEKNRDKIVIEVRGNKQNFPTNELLRIVFDGEPQPFSRTKDFTAQGQLEQAVEEFKKIDVGSLETDDMKLEYRFYKGYLAGLLALRGRGDPASALKQLTDWVKDDAQSHHFYPAAETMGDLALAGGSFDQAAKYYGGLATAPFPELKLKGSFLQAKALLAQNATAEAKTKFASVIEAKLSDPLSLKYQKLARVALIRCDAAEGKTEQAIADLEKMVDEGDSTDSELFCELFNTLGLLFATAGRNDEAELSYLKTDMLYPMQADAHAEALYQLSKVYAKMGNTQRAADAKQKLGKLYPTSPWTKK
jgi:tetratricopeptide (TPR) repeat protein